MKVDVILDMQAWQARDMARNLLDGALKECAHGRANEDFRFEIRKIKHTNVKVKKSKKVANAQDNN